MKNFTENPVPTLSMHILDNEQYCCENIITFTNVNYKVREKTKTRSPESLKQKTKLLMCISVLTHQIIIANQGPPAWKQILWITMRIDMLILTSPTIFLDEQIM